MRDGRPGRIFISYRRQDTAWPARQIYDVLVAEFGAGRVFKDVDDIAPGDDFVERIQSAVGSCDVLLALVGPAWLTAVDETGRRRLDDPEDFVRLEVETALTRSDVRVIPILIDPARMPKDTELPPSLAALARRQAVVIDPVSFDTRRLLATVRESLGVPRRPRTPTLLVSAAALLVATLVTLAVRAAGPGVASSVSGLPPSAATAVAPTRSSETAPSVPAATPATSQEPDSPTGPDVVAHRGGDEVFPLETEESLTNAAESGFAVETDVRWTKDRKAVVVHDDDATLGVQCDRPYRVSRTTWEELSKHCRSKEKKGRTYRIATYDGVLDGLSSSAPWLYLEVKVDQDAAQNKEFLARIREHGLSEHTVVTSTEPARLDALRRSAPELRYLQFVSTRVQPKDLKAHHLWGVAVKYDVASKAYVTSLKKAGLVVVVWTLNEEAGWRAARAAGADKVLTDKPRRYASWLAGR